MAHRSDLPEFGWQRHRSVARAEMTAVAAVHLFISFTLLAAPREQVDTPGTSIIFGTIPLGVWAVWYAVAGIASALAVHRNTVARLSLAWCGVFPLGFAWSFGFIVAVTHGRGNAVLAILYPALLLWWLALALRLHFGGTGTRWDSGSP